MQPPITDSDIEGTFLSDKKKISKSVLFFVHTCASLYVCMGVPCMHVESEDSLQCFPQEPSTFIETRSLIGMDSLSSLGRLDSNPSVSATPVLGPHFHELCEFKSGPLSYKISTL